MHILSNLLAGAAGCAIVAAMPASAQDGAGAPPAPADSSAQEAGEGEIIVTGIRGSLQSAQSLKRNADQVVDSIVAEDIGKLPDVNVTEALQRVSGIQVGRDRGEGSGITIRGLSQVTSTFNGRSGGSGRGVDLENIPAELIARVDVYKTPSADLVEGGIGGLINVVTRKPLDKPGFTLSGSARGRYSDLPDKVDPMFSALVSNTWEVGDGEFGILVAGSFQQRAFESHVVNVGAPVGQPNIGAGVASLSEQYQPVINADRRRIGIDAVIQYKPNPELEFYLQGTYQDAQQLQQQYGVYLRSLRNRTFDPASVEYFDGTNDVSRIAFTNVPVRTFGADRDAYEESWQIAGGVKFDSGPNHLSIDAAYTRGNGQLYYTELNLDTTAPRVDFDVTTLPGSARVSGVDLTSLNSFVVAGLARNINLSETESKQLRTDAWFEIDSNFLKSMHFGIRWTDADVKQDQLRFSQTPSAGGVPLQASAYSDLFILNPLNQMFGGTDLIEQNFYAANHELLDGDGFDAVRTRLGLTTPATFNPLFGYQIGESTLAGYVMGKFEVDGPIRVDGNIGTRIIRTNLNVNGTRALFTQRPGTGTGPGNPPVFDQTGYAPVQIDSQYVSVLPSANIRVRFTDTLQLRLAAAKTLTRPGFSSLSPTLSLVPGQRTGSAGNPDLRPLRANQLDASLEYYPSSTTSLYLAGFYREIEDFLVTRTSPQTIDGIDYSISRPTNELAGKIKGFEVGGQTFFDFLPGLLSGFGVQANYTFVDSKTDTSVAGLQTPIANLSKHSFNTSLIYEKGGLSARLAYNWRDKFYSSLLSNDIVTNVPVYTRARDWLDASIGYDITDKITVTIEGGNLLRSKTRTYFGVPTRPGNYEQDSRTIMAGVRFTL
ncbi:TonB-dependent receptor [Sphingomonas sp. BT-65]|uniref:TonB-dependent receptor n=1 Tax=Sphingomonas sp. BT-65 TaxID=2989821 RepID=UPI00223544E2|nr:TonB-dependent receptor [Sphingomonas sp. BT-65]MCW4462772.1 TonB-dependent receptor [Sphingomonas sp. BT-65]